MSASLFAKPISNLLNQLPAPPETVLHIGAGRGEYLSQFQEMGVSKVIHIEPTLTLTQHINPEDYSFELTIINRGVLPGTRTQTFYEANNHDYSGFTKPDSLRHLFPEILEIANSTLSGWPLKDCLNVSLTSEHTNLLILECPDICIDLCQSLDQGALNSVDYVIGTYYAQGSNGTSLASAMNDCQFWCTSSTAATHVNSFSAYNYGAQAQLLDGAQQAIRDREQSLEASQQAIRDCEQSLEESQQVLQKTHLDLKEESQVAQKFREQSQALVIDIKGMEEQITSLTQAASTQSSALNERTTENEALQQSIESLEETLENQNKDLIALTQKFEVEEGSKAETAYRQDLLDRELEKADAQLSLIRDVLIRDRL